MDVRKDWKKLKEWHYRCGPFELVKRTDGPRWTIFFNQRKVDEVVSPNHGKQWLKANWRNYTT